MTGHRVKPPEHKVVMRDEERDVLRAFGRKSNLCIHELHNLTGLSYPKLLGLMKLLVDRGDVEVVKDTALGKCSLQYISRKEQSMTSIQFIEERLSPLIGLSEQAMRGRVIMLKRMKRNLIIDWHPVIDVLLKDYERDLNRVEALREAPEAPDVLDRDFEYE